MEAVQTRAADAITAVQTTAAAAAMAGRDAAAGTVAATMTARKMRGVGAAMISVPNPGSSKGRFPLMQTRYADARNLPTTIVTGKGMIPSY